jgi:hypothetical protein
VRCFQPLSHLSNLLKYLGFFTNFGQEPKAACHRNCYRTPSLRAERAAYSMPERAVEPVGGVLPDRAGDVAVEVARGRARAKTA